jgi:photosystem II stability/assembly factor-like uncharacterized protein
MKQMDGLDLELRLRDHYRTMQVESSGAFRSRVIEALDRVPARRWPLLRPSRRMATAAAIAAAGLIVVAVAAAPLWFGSTAPAGLLASPTETAATPTLLGTAIGNPSQTQAPVASAGTPDPSALLASAQAAALGRMSAGGVWAIQHSNFVRISNTRSSRGDSYWLASNTEPPAMFVLNQDLAWTVTLAPGSVDHGQGPPYDHLNVIVNRKIDAGVAWNQASVPGDYTDSQFAIAFANSLVGYLIASPHRGGRSTVLATTDGGVTWSVVAAVSLLHGAPGAQFVASDAETLWAAAQGEPWSSHPVLAVSRDSGKTWSEVTLPGLEGQWGGDGAVQVFGPPVFVSPSVGFFTVQVDGSDPQVFGTTDAGRTWTVANFPAGLNVTASSLGSWSSADFVDATHWVAAADSTVQVTSDAGKTWKESLDLHLPAGRFVKVAFLDGSNGYGLFEPAGEADYYLYTTYNGGDSWGLQYSFP